MTQYFTNAQRLSRMYDTFEVPTYEELSKLKVNDGVKVCLNNERFWLLITAINGKTITGAVDNNLFFNDLAAGDVVTVRFSNVFETNIR